MSILLIAYLLGACQQANRVGSELIQTGALEQNRVSLSSAVFDGASKAQDNPWGMLAGVIDFEGEEVLFLTPDTSAQLSLEDETPIVIQYRIHPWVSEGSDGAGLLVWLMDEQGNILSQTEVLADAQGAWQYLRLNLEDTPDVAAIKLLCNNGGNGNNDADWLIVRLDTDKRTETAEEGETADEWETLRAKFINAKETEDNPWGTTAGIIEYDGSVPSILLTPNTGVCLYRREEDEDTMALSVEIHPWVRESSDGADLVICALNSAGDVLYTEKISLVENKGRTKCLLDWKLVPEVAAYRLQCGNGGKNNDDCDWVLITADRQYSSSFGKDAYVTAATYFGNEWPVNFWNSEMDRLEADLRQIKDDGFNSIILVVPWREFQPGIDPVTYNDYAFEQLDRVLSAAREEELAVYARIGYFWDFYDDEENDIYERFSLLLSDDNMRNAWLEYAQRLYTHLQQYPNFGGAFLTWEDFWGILNACNIPEEEKRIELADAFGYRAWVQKHYPLPVYNEQFGTSYTAYELIPIPSRNEPAMQSMYVFFDEFLNTFLHNAQEVFPNLSYEVRLDADLVYNQKGDAEFFSHESTYACEAADYVAAMYGIPMGFENIGENVTAQEAIKHTEYILGRLLTADQGKPVFVEQFLFYDNTPAFQYNARVQDGEIGDYLALAAEILPDYTAGYGIWTYRDYRNNMLYNTGFYLGGKGWRTDGAVSFEPVSESMSAHLKAPASIEQKVGTIRDHFGAESYTLSFEVVNCPAPASMIVRMGTEAERIEVLGCGSYSVSLPRNNGFDFSLEIMDGDLYIDNVCLYSFVQNGCLYGWDNEEMEWVNDVRALNEKLSQAAR